MVKVKVALTILHFNRILVSVYFWNAFDTQQYLFYSKET